MAEPEPGVPVTKICQTCVAFVPSGAPTDGCDGWCHQSPPRVFATMPTAGQTRWVPGSFWPAVLNADWCLQWAAKP
jgi:hypothetical protein